MLPFKKNFASFLELFSSKLVVTNETLSKPPQKRDTKNPSYFFYFYFLPEIECVCAAGKLRFLFFPRQRPISGFCKKNPRTEFIWESSYARKIQSFLICESRRKPGVTVI